MQCEEGSSHFCPPATGLPLWLAARKLFLGTKEPKNGIDIFSVLISKTNLGGYEK